MARNQHTFKKGREKTGGRKAGTPNKTTAISREIMEDIANLLLPKIKDDIENLTGKERIDAFLKVVKYLIPEPKSIDIALSTEHKKTIEDLLKNLAEEN